MIWHDRRFYESPFFEITNAFTTVYEQFSRPEVYTVILMLFLSSSIDNIKTSRDMGYSLYRIRQRYLKTCMLLVFNNMSQILRQLFHALLTKLSNSVNFEMAK